MNTTEIPGVTTEICPILQVYLDVFYIYVYAIGPTTVLGLIFNIIILIVLNKQKSKLNSLYLLKLLAVSDLVFLLDCFIYFPVRHLSALAIQGDEIFRRWDLDIGPYIFTATIPIYFAAQQNRNWLIVLITVERFLNLVFPLWARSALTKRRLTYAFIVNIIISIGCGLPNYWIYPLVKTVNPCTGEDEMTVIWQVWGRDYDYWIYVIMTLLIPLFLLYFMNITLIIVLNRMFKRRQQMTGSATDKDALAQRQATMMVIGITILFSVCETPASLDRIAMIAGIEFSKDDPFFNYGRKVGLFLVVLDSALNFVTYCISNRRFRQTFLELCCCRKSTTDSMSSSTGSSQKDPSTVYSVTTVT